MQKFSERLVEARNDKHLTQEALANAVGVTRSTVSSWERGRTTPSMEMIERLSNALDRDFARADEAEPVEEEVADEEVAEGEMIESHLDLPEDAETGADAPATPEASKRPKLAWLVAAAAVLVCVIVAVSLTRGHRTSDPDAAAFAEYYARQTPDDADRPFIAFENTQWEEKGDGASFTRYAFTLREQNGHAFDIVTAKFALAPKSGGQAREITLSAADLKAADVETHIEPNGETAIDGGFPLGEFTRVGAEIEGEDEDGNALTFYSMIEFTQ